MKGLRSILFVSQGLGNETNALRQALYVARDNGAELKVLVVCPELPREMEDYRDKYESALAAQVESSLRAAEQALGPGGGVRASVDVESGATPAVRIIRRVLRDAHDMVVKEAEPEDGGKGFRALDMELLRKCPCPVFLCRSVEKRKEDMKVAAAIDPESPSPTGRDLSLLLLRAARSCADACDGELHIISCWDYEFEDYLRHNPAMGMSGAEVDRVVRESQDRSRAALDALVEEAGIPGKTRIHHLRGRAGALIPAHTAREGVDVLVMGTLARTGIPGFIIGNTAENVAQKLHCSLLALKPNGFVSPVKAY